MSGGCESNCCLFYTADTCLFHVRLAFLHLQRCPVCGHAACIGCKKPVCWRLNIRKPSQLKHKNPFCLSPFTFEVTPLAESVWCQIWYGSRKSPKQMFASFLFRSPLGLIGKQLRHGQASDGRSIDTHAGLWVMIHPWLINFIQNEKINAACLNHLSPLICNFSHPWH